MESYSVRVGGDEFLATASHFITLASGECEPLHGHDYRTAVEVSGPLDDDGLVVDFRLLCQTVRTILAEWDHRVLLPGGSPVIRVSRGPEEVEVSHGGRRWVFPRSDVAILPIPATTTELLAGYLARRILVELSARSGHRATNAAAWTIRVELSESGGQSARCELQP